MKRIKKADNPCIVMIARSVGDRELTLNGTFLNQEIDCVFTEEPHGLKIGKNHIVYGFVTEFSDNIMRLRIVKTKTLGEEI